MHPQTKAGEVVGRVRVPGTNMHVSNLLWHLDDVNNHFSDKLKFGG
jgi:hypothetical protein